MSFKMQSYDAEDILARIDAVGIPRAGVDRAALLASTIGDDVKNMLCRLATAINCQTAAAQRTATALQEEGAGSKKIEKALREYEKTVCGRSWFNASNPSPWQASLQRLIGHLQANRLIAFQSSKDHQPSSADDHAQGSPAAAWVEPYLNKTCTATLRETAALLSCESADTAEDQLRAITSNLEKLLDNMPEPAKEPLISKTSLTEDEVQALQQIYSAFKEDYTVRRKMLIGRAKVTLESLLWAKEWLEQQGTLEEATQAANDGQDSLSEEPGVAFDDVFTAELGDIVSVTSRPIQQDKDKVRATVKDYIIGEVPDRGGRPLEGREGAAKAAMPAWTDRRPGGTQSSRGGSQGNRGGVQGRRGGREGSNRGRRGKRG